ncbi:MAG TPA: hypothetical protein VF209_02260 [Patescibacteria group bacterium]
MATKQDEIHSTTQTFLDIFDITNDILINKDGSTALILQVNALNFGLLAEEEQDSIMYAYAGLLNSLNYPIQIVIRSQTKDVTNYLNLLKEEEDKAVAPMQKERISRYRAFVSELIKERNVLDKKFYVAIPASALEMGLMPPSTVVPGVKQPDLTTVERSVILDKATEVLEPKRDHLVSQFARIGLIARQLTTQEIIQLFYLSYNPEAAEGQQLTDTSSYTTPLVRASVQGGYMPDSTNPSSPQPMAAPVAPSTIPQPEATPPSLTTDQAAPISSPAVGAQDATPSTPPMTTPVEPASPAAPATPPATPAAPTSPVTPPSMTPSITPPTGSAPPATPAAPAIQEQPSVTSVTSPAAPAAPSLPSMGTPTPAATPSTPAPETDAQAEINSTLQQLGSTPAGSSMGTPTPPATSPNTSVPPTQPPSITPGATPAPASNDAAKDDLPPVAEI